MKKQLGSYDALGDLLNGQNSDVTGAVKNILLLRADKGFLSGGADFQKKAIAGITGSLTSSQGKLVDQILADHKVDRPFLERITEFSEQGQGAGSFVVNREINICSNQCYTVGSMLGRWAPGPGHRPCMVGRDSR